MRVEDDGKWDTIDSPDSWGPSIPPPPAEMPPPPPPIGSPPPPVGPPPPSMPPPIESTPSPTIVQESPNPIPQTIESRPKGPSIITRLLNETDMPTIFNRITSSKVVISVILSLGFLMLILSASYSNSAEYTNAPDAPDAILSSDFDNDSDGLLNASENENFTAALSVYSDDMDAHNDLMNTYTGNAIFWNTISSAFIVGGMICLTFLPNASEMSNSVRVTLLIGTIYMLAGMLGYDMPGVDAAIGLGFGGD
jgi:hypothetical protein